ncbi:MAG: hypothetical protein J5I90_05285 [Caldilineales bacterium]|nr:hypothetical protein [Caldilineales bacterium]
MNGFLKLVGGLIIGAAAGTAIYLALTSDDEEGFIHDMKTLANDVVSDGRRAASERRMTLERELSGQVSMSDTQNQ